MFYSSTLIVTIFLLRFLGVRTRFGTSEYLLWSRLTPFYDTLLPTMESIEVCPSTTPMHTCLSPSNVTALINVLPRITMLNGGTPKDDYRLRRQSRLDAADDDVTHKMRYKSKRRKLDVSTEQYRWWLRQQRSEKEYPALPQQPNEEECRPMYDWQETSYPACNDMHLWDFYDQLSTDNDTELLGQGTWRITFRVKEYDGTRLAFKMLRASEGRYGEGEFSAKNYDAHRRDAVMYEKLSPSSQNVLHMYGYCGMSGAFELADGGVLKKNLWFTGGDGLRHDAPWSMSERLRIATQIAIGLKEIHGAGGGDYPAFSICDLQIDQILLVNGVWKVSDFNRGHWIRWNDETHEPCKYFQQYGAGSDLGRSPEEFMSDELTPAVDVYHLGTIMYSLLTFMKPYSEIILLAMNSGQDLYDARLDVVHNEILHGFTPRIPRHLLARKDPSTVALIRATLMCVKYGPHDRATAAEVADYLVDQLKKIEGFVGDMHKAPPRIVFYTTGGTARRFYPRPRNHNVYVSNEQRKFLARQQSPEKDYPAHAPQPIEEECQPIIFDWHETSYDRASDMHQWDLYDQLLTDNDTKLFGEGICSLGE